MVENNVEKYEGNMAFVCFIYSHDEGFSLIAPHTLYMMFFRLSSGEMLHVCHDLFGKSISTALCRDRSAWK